MSSFELITRFNRPVAAIVPERMTGAQIRSIYQLLPQNAQLHTGLTKRWGVWAVMATEDWSRDYFKFPGPRPNGIKLSIG